MSQLKHTIYIPSKGRWDCCHTADLLLEDDLDFYIVVEKEEYKKYSEKYGENKILVLPFSNLGLGVYPTRNWIKNFSKEKGEQYHWQFDDDITSVSTYTNRKKTKQSPKYILNLMEQFNDKYVNIAISALSSDVFAFAKSKPFGINKMCCSCILIRSDLPYQWRCKLGHDADMSIQVLKGGWCTVEMNAFVYSHKPVGNNKGGLKDIYEDGGRSKKISVLQKFHPELPIKTSYRFNRVNSDTSKVWRRFKQPLIKK
jgi:hypothetical protein